MTPSKIRHAFGDDALGTWDAVALRAQLRKREVSASELVDAAFSRLAKVNELNAVVSVQPEAARALATSNKGYGLFAGIPTFIKDNTDVMGFETRLGSKALPPIIPQTPCAFTEQFMQLGMLCLGKSQLPEFGFNASTEFDDGSFVANPWNIDYSPGASSGGSAALVAAGVVPVAHANDGGGSIRIPAACCGLVGLKPSRDRFINSEVASKLPINIIGEGIVSRSVRDTAYFFAGMEQQYCNPKLPSIGLVSEANKRRLRIGVVAQTLNGAPIDAEVMASLEQTQWLLEDLGHMVELIGIPVYEAFSLDFCRYWGFLAFSVAKFGKYGVHPEFDQHKMSAFSKGLVQYFYKQALPSPLFIRRLKQIEAQYTQTFAKFDVVLSPTLAHVTPKIGYLSPQVEFDILFERLRQWVCFTPLNNVSGGPAMSLPLGMSREGLPIGMHFSAAIGAERTLLELAYEIEQAKPWQQLFDIQQRDISAKAG